MIIAIVVLVVYLIIGLIYAKWCEQKANDIFWVTPVLVTIIFWLPIMLIYFLLKWLGKQKEDDIWK